MKKLLIVIGGLLFFTTLLLSQSQIGLRADSYAGIHAAGLNPAATALSPISWDVSLAGGYVFFENNYIFIESATIGSLASASQIIARPNQEGNFEPNGALFADYKATYKRKYGTVHTAVLGPSVMVNLPNGLAFGLTTAFRFSATTRNYPVNYSHYENKIIPYDSLFTVTKSQIALAAWSEIGLNGAYKFEMGDGFMSVGANIKWLGAYQGGFANYNQDAQFMKREPDTTRIYGAANADIGLTQDIIRSEGVTSARNGRGVGIDLGVIMASDFDENEYRWKIGASLVDIGRISYNTNAIRHHFSVDAQDSIFIYEGNYTQYTGSGAFDNVTRQASYDVFGDSIKSYVGSKFNIMLPTKIVLQGEIRPIPNVYIHGVWTQRLSQLFTSSTTGLLTAENMIAVTPRYERKWLMVCMPIELYNYTRPRIGLATRIGPLTIGTDKLGSFLVPNSLTGTDFYFALRVYPFWPKKERVDNNGRRRSPTGDGKAYRLPRGRMKKCYDFQ